MSFGMVEQRKLMIKAIVITIKKISPIDKDELVANIMYEHGLTRNKTREYIKLLKDIKKIKTDDEGVLTWIGD